MHADSMPSNQDACLSLQQILPLQMLQALSLGCQLRQLLVLKNPQQPTTMTVRLDPYCLLSKGQMRGQH